MKNYTSTWWATSEETVKLSFRHYLRPSSDHKGNDSRKWKRQPSSTWWLRNHTLNLEQLYPMKPTPWPHLEVLLLFSSLPNFIFSQSPYVFIYCKTSYWYLDLLGSYTRTLNSMNFCFWFSFQLQGNHFDWNHSFLDLRCVDEKRGSIAHNLKGRFDHKLIVTPQAYIFSLKCLALP